MVEPKKTRTQEEEKKKFRSEEQMGQIDDTDLINSGREDELRCEIIGNIGSGQKSSQIDPAIRKDKERSL